MQTWLNLQDKIIIVTGGASGIGLAIVEELLAQDANVQMVDIHGGDGQYEGHKGYQFWPTDISSAKEVNHTVAEIIQRFGRIDGLVDNQDSMNVDELCEHLTQIAKQTCVVWKQLATAEEDF